MGGLRREGVLGHQMGLKESRSVLAEEGRDTLSITGSGLVRASVMIRKVGR